MPSAALQECLKRCSADISTSAVTTLQLAGGSKVAAGAMQIVGLSVERGISPLNPFGLGQSAEIL